MDFRRSGQLDERYTLDGLHLTHAAYVRWAERLGAALGTGAPAAGQNAK